MRFSRRTVIKALPLAGVGAVALPQVIRHWQPASKRKADAVVVYEDEDSQGVRFAQAFPASVRRFVLVHAGAEQLESLEALLADRSVVVAGLTGVASFIVLQRLAVEAGRFFAMSGDHRPGYGRQARHTVMTGLTGVRCATLARGDDWAERLTHAFLAMPEMQARIAGDGALPCGNSPLVRRTRATKRLHSWFLV